MTTSTPPVLRAAPDDPIAGRMVFVGCSRRKLATTIPVPALQLYQGGAVPALRARVGGRAKLRDRVRILSAEHGLLNADTPVLPYDRPLTPARADQLYAQVGATLMTDLLAHGVPRAVLVVAEPLYLSLIVDLFWIPGLRPALTWVAHHALWPHAAAVLDRWGWP
jgi:hypothetical protein